MFVPPPDDPSLAGVIMSTETIRYRYSHWPIGMGPSSSFESNM
jgi:hypothetical protein